MSIKLKSLLYLSCFIIAALIYNFDSSEDVIQEFSQKELAEIDVIIQPFGELQEENDTE